LKIVSNKLDKLFPFSIFVIGLIISFYCYNKPLSDFSNYYFGSKILMSGQNVWNEIYDVASFNKNVINEGFQGLFLSHTSVPPQSLIFYTPFSLIDNPYLSKFIFNILGVCIFSFVIFLLQTKGKLILNHKWILLLFFIIPLYYNLLFGQTYLYIAAVVLVLIYASSRWMHLTAILLAISISIKITPIVFLLYYFLKKQYRIVFYTLAYCVVIFVFSWFVVGEETMYNFFKYILPKLLDGYVNDPFSSSYHNVITILRDCFLYDEVLNPSVYVSLTTSMIGLINAIICGIVLLVTLQSLNSEKISKSNAFIVLIVLMNIISGYTSTYSLLIMFPAILFNQERMSSLFYILLALICFLPPRMMEDVGPLLAHYKLYLFFGLFLVLISEDRVLRISMGSWLVLSVFTVLSIVKIAVSNQRPTFLYYQPKVLNEHFIVDATISNVQLSYVFYNYSGYNEKVLIDSNLKDNCSDYLNDFYKTSLFLKDGTQIKSIGCFGDTVVVLSDYNRGPGLYNLFKVQNKEYQKLIH
jgi:hypothetical protein